MSDSDKKEIVSRSWFCVFNNPNEHGFEGEPQEICDKIVASWVDECPTRSCAVTYCVSADGLKHCHVVLEDTKVMRFSALKKAFPSMHIEPTKGNKEQAEDYINKVGKWEEKGEVILASARHGEIKGSQGQRRDFEVVADLIEQGFTPHQIFEQNFAFRRYDKMIKQAYFDKRMKSVPLKRNVLVKWHVGSSGSGKTHEYVDLCEKYGDDDVYLLNDYGKGGFDDYIGQKVLCMDEFRGYIRFSLLMNYLDGYRVQIPCRYANGYALWEEIHIFTVLPPEKVYEMMIQENRCFDTYEQLTRRIDFVVYHYKDEQGNFHKFELPMCEYKGYEDLRKKAMKHFSGELNFYDDFPENIPQNNLHFDE